MDKGNRIGIVGVLGVNREHKGSCWGHVGIESGERQLELGGNVEA